MSHPSHPSRISSRSELSSSGELEEKKHPKLPPVRQRSRTFDETISPHPLAPPIKADVEDVGVAEEDGETVWMKPKVRANILSYI